MVCSLKDGVKYSRKELVEIAKECKIKYISKLKKIDLYNKIKNISSASGDSVIDIKNRLVKCNFKLNNKQIENIAKIIKKNNVTIPTSIKEKSFKKPVNSKPLNVKPLDNFEEFALHLDKELMGFINKPNIKPLMRAFVPGGYGLRMLFKHRFHKNGVIAPGDLDITISTDKSKLSPQKCYEHLKDKCISFIKSRPDPQNYKMSIMKFPPTYNPILKMRRFSLLSIYYKGDEFVDLVITDRAIDISEMDIQVSNKCHLPIKKPDGYLFEYFQIIYMENVQGVDNYCYLKRNPVTGTFKCKGLKDITRVKLLCNYAGSEKYAKHCHMMKQLESEKLKNMTASQRNVVFRQLRNMI